MSRKSADVNVERHGDHVHTTVREGDRTYCTTAWDDGVVESHEHVEPDGPPRMSPTHTYVMRAGVLFCLQHDGMCEAPGEVTH